MEEEIKEDLRRRKDLRGKASKAAKPQEDLISLAKSDAALAAQVYRQAFAEEFAAQRLNLGESLRAAMAVSQEVLSGDLVALPEGRVTKALEAWEPCQELS